MLIPLATVKGVSVVILPYRYWCCECEN